MTTDPAGNRYHAPGHRVYVSAGPNNGFVERCAVFDCMWRPEREVALACEAEGHAWTRDGADPIHGVCGLCACGSRLYSLTGELIEP